MRYFTLALLWGLSFIGGAYAQNLPPATQFDACVTGIDATFASQGFGRLRCDSNGNLLITGISGGGGGGGGNAAVTSNATDGQATSTTNQQNVVYGYIFNGSTWDRQRGTGGASNVIITSTLPAFAATPTFNVGTTNGLALDATLTARLGTLGQKASAGSAPVVLASDQPGIPITNITGTITLPTGAATATNQSTEITALNTLNTSTVSRSTWSVDTALSATLATGTTTGGAVKTNGGNPSPYTWFRVNARADQPVVLLILGSDDGFATFDEVYRQTMTANATIQAQVPLFYTAYRAAIQNATGNSSAVKVRTSFTTN